MNIKQALTMQSRLIKSDSPRLDAELLLCHVLQKDRVYLIAHNDRPLSHEQQQSFERLLSRREAGEPVAYLLGQKEFYGLAFNVNRHTLIPRPDTELLVALAIEAGQARDVHTCLDLGTGTGAIAISIAAHCRSINVYAVDRVAEAVALAQGNCQLHGLSNVTCMQSDWFDAVADQTFELIVSNPPYIDAQDPHLQQGDVQFEPRSALVAAQQGLSDLAHIVHHARNVLLPSGVLMVEHGFDQGKAVRDLFTKDAYIDVQTHRDLAGHERVTMGKITG